MWGLTSHRTAANCTRPVHGAIHFFLDAAAPTVSMSASVTKLRRYKIIILFDFKLRVLHYTDRAQAAVHGSGAHKDISRNASTGAVSCSK